MLLIDAHVHIYDCYDLSQLLNSAEKNFKQPKDYSCTIDTAHILLLANRSDQQWPAFFSSQNNASDTPLTVTGWNFAVTEETQSVIAENESGFKITIIAGRQLISAEGLEVLSLLTMESFQEGATLDNLIADIHIKGGLAVLPWAFGKWFGKRGQVIQVLQKQSIDEKKKYFFADNGGRPWCIPMSPVLRKELQQQRFLISGSDPLPLAGEEIRVGSMGIKIEAAADHRKPAAQLYSLLCSPKTTVFPYGKASTALGFVTNQCRLRMG